jgi:hypothetical protein
MNSIQSDKTSRGTNTSKTGVKEGSKERGQCVVQGIHIVQGVEGCFGVSVDGIRGERLLPLHP